MILTLMLIILTATLVIVIIGFVMDRLEIRKIQSGMRTLNKRIKKLQEDATPMILEVDTNENLMTPQTINKALTAMEANDDTQTDSETQEADGGDIPAETDDTIQTTGD